MFLYCSSRFRDGALGGEVVAVGGQELTILGASSFLVRDLLDAAPEVVGDALESHGELVAQDWP